MDSSTSIRILVGTGLASILWACGGSASELETDVETGTVRQRSELTAVTKAYGERDKPPPGDDVVISGNEGDLIEVITVTSGGSASPENDPLTHNALAVPGLLPPTNDDGSAGSGATVVVPVEGVDITVP